MYTIKRECYNEKTFNGYTDNPYWRIEFSYHKIGLKDDGKFWSIVNGVDCDNEFVKQELKRIIEECKLKINLNI